MSGKRIIVLGLSQALGTVLYVALVVLVLVGSPSTTESPDVDGQAMEYLTAVGVLLLFVISACISGALVLGYPAILALRQRIRDAVLLVAATVVWLILLLAVVVVIINSGIAGAS